jgi:hypothetical protein
VEHLRHKGLIISILIGEADETEIVYRNGANKLTYYRYW